MNNKLNFIITGATAAMLLLPMKAEAQRIGLGMRSSVPASVLNKAEKLTPAAIHKKEMANRAKHPLLYRARVASNNNLPGLTRVRTGSITAPMTLEPKVPLRAPANIPGRELWGSVIIDNTWTTDNMAYGFYRFYAGNNIAVEPLGLNSYIKPNGSGAIVDGKLYLVNFIDIYGYTSASLYKFNTDTWELEEMAELDDLTMVASETATAKDGTVYGTFFNKENDGIELGIADYPNKTRTTIGALKNQYVALGITADNVLYGIDMKGDLYKIDTKTAKETKIGPTGVKILDQAGTYQIQSGEIDQATGVFYWACYDANNNANLYTVNLTTGAAELVGEFTNDNAISLLTLPKAYAEGAPAEASELKTEFADGSLSGKVSFKLPAKNLKGDNLTGSLTYTISEGKTTLKTGSGTPGATITENVTCSEDGMKAFCITASNSEGEGKTAKAQAYVGYDTPKAVEDLTFDITDGGNVTLSWKAVTAGVNGAYLGDIKYSVVRYPGAVEVEKDLTSTSFSEKITDENIQAYSYGVKACNARMTGKETKTGEKVFGEAIIPPYSEDFENKSAMSYFTIIDNNKDGKTWAHTVDDDENGEVFYEYNDKKKADDWLITSPVKMEKGKTYTLKFKAKSTTPAFMERLEVKYGSSNTVAGMTNELMPATDLPPRDFTEYCYDIAPTEDGKVYIGFHAVSDAGKFWLHLDDISISAGKSASAPAAATDLSVIAGDKGAKQALISFKAPTKAIDGTTLTGSMTAKISRDGEIIKELTNVAPGSNQRYVDESPKNGNNTYTVTMYSSGGEGVSTPPTTVYVGVDTPAVPELNAIDNTSSVRITWTDAEEGANGGFVDKQTLKHNIYTLEKGEYGVAPVFAAEVPAGTMQYDKACNTNEGEQQMMQYAVTAVNEAGESKFGVTPAVIVGKPYSIPFAESVAGGDLSYGMWWTATEKFQIGMMKDSSDGDGACFAMLSSSDEGFGTLGTGKISLAGAVNPTFIFCHKAAAGSNAKINISVRKPDGTEDDLKTFDASKDAGKWVRESISLKPEYASLPYIMVKITCTANADEIVYMDEIYVRDVYENDLSLESLTAPAMIKKGENAKVSVKVSNYGSAKAKDFTVKLFAGDELVDSKVETKELEPFASRIYDLNFASTVLHESSSIELKAEVEYESDLNMDNNSKSATLAFNVSNKPRPASVSAVQNTDGFVDVTWSAVPETIFDEEESFENYESWTTNNFGAWTTDLGSTPEDAQNGGIFNGFEYPAQYTRFGFILAEPLNNWVPENAYDAIPTLKPHGGNKYLAAFYKYSSNSTTDVFYDSDDWLISPELSGNKQTISFYAANNNSEKERFPETFDVLYSTGGTAVKDFMKVGETHTISKGTWEEVNVEIPEGAKRFAIHHNTVSSNCFFFQLDDFKYEVTSGKVIGYRVYRDGKLLTQVDADKLSFTDSNLRPTTTYIYSVTAVFADGESEATIATAITTSIDSVEDVLKASSYDVYTTDGKLVGKGMKTLKTLKNGSYIINDQKVIIR